MDLVTLLTVCAVGGATPAVDTPRAHQPGGTGHHAFIEANGATEGLISQQVTSAAIDQWQPLIAEASRRFAVPAAWIRAVMQAESGGRTMLDGRPITSRAGATGLMQVMPETYEEMRLRYGLGGDPHDPRDNILAGTAYLREMYDRYGYPGVFAAYNAGPARFDAHLLTGRSLAAETQRYLAALSLPSLDVPRHHELPSGRDLFFKLGTSVMDRQSQRPDPASGGLFVPLSKNRPALPNEESP
jgi:membrane-bound lytic murein transglycosylase B